MKKVPAVRLVERDLAPELGELPDELRLAMTDVAAAAREGLLAMSVAVGLRVMAELLETELATKVGPKHAKQPGRAARRHGSAPGSVVLGGRRVPVDRPRARTVDGREVTLETYAAFAADDLLGQVVMERMLAGLATRRHRAAGEPVGAQVEQQARSTSRSAVSRRFVAQTARALEGLLGRDLSDLKVAVLMVDGITIAEHCCVVALAILADGRQAAGRAVAGLDREHHGGDPPAGRPSRPGSGRLRWAAGGDRRGQGARQGRAQGVRPSRADPTLHHP